MINISITLSISLFCLLIIQVLIDDLIVLIYCYCYHKCIDILVSPSNNILLIFSLHFTASIFVYIYIYKIWNQNNISIFHIIEFDYCRITSNSNNIFKTKIIINNNKNIIYSKIWIIFRESKIKSWTRWKDFVVKKNFQEMLLKHRHIVKNNNKNN